MYNNFPLFEHKQFDYYIALFIHSYKAGRVDKIDREVE